MKIVYIAHPIGGDVKANLKDLRRIIRHINLKMPDIVPCAPYYADCVSMDDNIISQRIRGLTNDITLIKTGVFRELWLTGSHLSMGMFAEQTLFTEMGLPVIDLIGKI